MREDMDEMKYRLREDISRDPVTNSVYDSLEYYLREHLVTYLETTGDMVELNKRKAKEALDHLNRLVDDEESDLVAIEDAQARLEGWVRWQLRWEYWRGKANSVLDEAAERV